MKTGQFPKDQLFPFFFMKAPLILNKEYNLFIRDLPKKGSRHVASLVQLRVLLRWFVLRCYFDSEEVCLLQPIGNRQLSDIDLSKVRQARLSNPRLPTAAQVLCACQVLPCQLPILKETKERISRYQPGGQLLNVNAIDDTDFLSAKQSNEMQLYK